MAETSARLLRLLSLLQAKPEWNGPELADRLQVTVRTVRRDVDRLRGLGYPVDAQPGVSGGYRLGVGARLPPLLLDDDEAVAVAVALAALAGGGVRGMEDSALAALTKLDRLLPPALRDRVGAVRSATVRLATTVDEVDSGMLLTLAQAAASLERVRADYVDHGGRRSERRLEPFRLVHTGRRWYLVAYDLDRHDWRTFRVDRLQSVTGTGHRFVREDPPDAAALVSRSTTIAPYRYEVRVVVDAPLADVARRIPPTVGVVEDRGDGTTLFTSGGDSLEAMVWHLVGLGLPFEVLEPDELRALLADLGRRLVDRHA